MQSASVVTTDPSSSAPFRPSAAEDLEEAARRVLAAGNDSRSSLQETVRTAPSSGVPLALPLATFAVSGFARRELSALCNYDLANLYRTTLELRDALLASPGFRTSETLREAHDRLELGRRALAKIAAERGIVPRDVLAESARDLVSKKGRSLPDWIRLKGPGRTAEPRRPQPRWREAERVR